MQSRTNPMAHDSASLVRIDHPFSAIVTQAGTL
jgi:hypothetical protein